MNRREFLKTSTAGAIAASTVGALLLQGCDPQPFPTPSPSPTPGAPISPAILALIQTAATIATGAVLNFAVNQVSTKTQLANQIYSSANALYEASGGTPLTPTALAAILNSFSLGSVAQYAQYVTGLQSLYTYYYDEYIANGSATSQSFASIVNAIAVGAEAGAQTYETITTAS